MRMDAVTDIMTMVLIVVAIALIALFLVFFSTRRYNDTLSQSEAARDAIREFRKKRLSLIKQVLSMFGTGNPHAEGLMKLGRMYGSIDSEQKEIAWEHKYISVMKKYMASAKSGIPSNMVDAWKLANAAINENEQLLDGARESYEECRRALSAYEKGPQRIAVSVGERVMEIMRSHAADREARELEEESERAGVSISSDDGGVDAGRRRGSVSGQIAQGRDGRGSTRTSTGGGAGNTQGRR